MEHPLHLVPEDPPDLQCSGSQADYAPEALLPIIVMCLFDFTIISREIPFECWVPDIYLVRADTVVRLPNVEKQRM